jgi:LacI family transcriptional regulator
LTPRNRVCQRRNRLRNRLSGGSPTDARERAARAQARRKPTLADVAQRAGVSTSTASRALNGHTGLAPATRAAVVEAAARLNFHPSALARSLRTQQTHTVGFVVPDVASPFYAAALKGAQGRLEQAGYRVMLMDANQDVERELAALETLLSHQVDGLLVATAGMPRPTFDDAVSPHPTPAIFFDGVIDGAGEGTVTLDNAGGIALLVEHLAEHGHRRIAFLAGSLRESAGAERLAAFRAAAAARGVEPPERHVKLCEWDIAAARLASTELLDDPDRPSAVIASSAELALGFLAAAAAARAAIPDDVALVSFDDPYFGRLLDPPLTAIGYDPSEIGASAAGLLVDAMRSGDGSQRHVRVPVTLVRRRSCGCVMDEDA